MRDRVVPTLIGFAAAAVLLIAAVGAWLAFDDDSSGAWRAASGGGLPGDFGVTAGEIAEHPSAAGARR